MSQDFIATARATAFDLTRTADQLAEFNELASTSARYRRRRYARLRWRETRRATLCRRATTRAIRLTCVGRRALVKVVAAAANAYRR